MKTFRHGPLCAALMFATLISCQAVQRQSQVNSRLSSLYEPPSSSAIRKIVLPGRYIGYFRPKSSNYKIPMIIDLIASRTKAGVTRFLGIAKYSLGGFNSDEFRTEYYPHIVFNHETKAFAAAALNRQFEFFEVELKGNSIISGGLKDNGKFAGDFLVIYAGSRRALNVEALVSKVFPERSVFPSLSGRYSGQCKDKSAVLQLDLTRWNYDNTPPAGFLAHYKSFATLGYKNEGGCSVEKACAKMQYSDSVLDIYASTLEMIEGKRAMSCSVSSTGLQCGNECELVRRSLSQDSTTLGLKQIVHRQERDDRLSLDPSLVLGSEVDFVGAVSGEYFGYLFNETTLRHQMFRLKVDAEMLKEQGMKKPSVSISGISTMFFGPMSDNEFVVNRFDSAFYSETGPHFVFEGEGDKIVQVSKWASDGMLAILYSKSFGRIGTLALRRGKAPPVPENALLVNKISGTYRGPVHSISLIAQANVSDTMHNYFPMVTRGVCEQAAGGAPVIIKDMTYDAYSGQVGILLEDGRLAVGQETANGFALTWPSRIHSGEAMVSQEPEMLHVMRTAEDKTVRHVKPNSPVVN